MKSKKFMKGVILVIGILAILFSSLSVIKMFNLLSNEGLMRLIRSADLITFCAIIQVIILTILIIKMCICMSKFSDNAFSEDPFKKIR